MQPPQESSTPRTPPLPQPSDQPAHQSSPQLVHQPAHRPATVSALGFEATLTLTTIHTSRYLDFPAQAWAEWAALDPANAAKDAFPPLWPVRSFRTDLLPVNFSARMGLFLFDAGTPITSGTWAAARAGADYWRTVQADCPR